MNAGPRRQQPGQPDTSRIQSNNCPPCTGKPVQPTPSPAGDDLVSLIVLVLDSASVAGESHELRQCLDLWRRVQEGGGAGESKPCRGACSACQWGWGALLGCAMTAGRAPSWAEGPCRAGSHGTPAAAPLPLGHTPASPCPGPPLAQSAGAATGRCWRWRLLTTQPCAWSTIAMRWPSEPASTAWGLLAVLPVRQPAALDWPSLGAARATCAATACTSWPATPVSVQLPACAASPLPHNVPPRPCPPQADAAGGRGVWRALLQRGPRLRCKLWGRGGALPARVHAQARPPLARLALPACGCGWTCGRLEGGDTLRRAALRRAALRCAVPCRAALRCAVLCCGASSPSPWDG